MDIIVIDYIYIYILYTYAIKCPVRGLLPGLGWGASHAQNGGAMGWPWLGMDGEIPKIPRAWGFHGKYPLVMTNSLLLKMAIEIVSFSINKCDFP